MMECTHCTLAVMILKSRHGIYIIKNNQSVLLNLEVLLVRVKAIIETL